MRTNRTARATLVLLLVAGMSFGTMGAQVGAQENAAAGPPQMDLRWPGHSVQEGTQWSYCWSEQGGAGMCADMVGSSPKAMWVRSGATLKVRIHHAEKPTDFGGTTWRRVDANGMPKGEGRNLRFRLKPVVRNGETRAWDAFFSVGGDRHHHIMVFGVWPQGDASWRFHVKTVR